MSTTSQVSEQKEEVAVKKSARLMKKKQAKTQEVKEEHQMRVEAKKKARVQKKKPTAAEAKGKPRATGQPLSSSMANSVQTGPGGQIASSVQTGPSIQMTSSVQTGYTGPITYRGGPRIRILTRSRLFMGPRGLVAYRPQRSSYDQIGLHGQTGAQEEISTRGRGHPCGSRLSVFRGHGCTRGLASSRGQVCPNIQAGPLGHTGSHSQASPQSQAVAYSQAGPYDQAGSHSAQLHVKLPSDKKGMIKYDQGDPLNLDGEDLCDCLERGCPGCFYPCPECQSTKRGPTCRHSRKWIYEAIADKGGEVVSTFPFPHAKY